MDTTPFDITLSKTVAKNDYCWIGEMGRGRRFPPEIREHWDGFYLKVNVDNYWVIVRLPDDHFYVPKD